MIKHGLKFRKATYYLLRTNHALNYSASYGFKNRIHYNHKSIQITIRQLIIQKHLYYNCVHVLLQIFPTTRDCMYYQCSCEFQTPTPAEMSTC